MTGSGRYLVASLREPRELLVLDLHNGGERRVPTRRATDTLFDRTEPETLLPVGLGDRVLLLMASSDSEQGNQLVPFDAASGRLGRALEGVGEGVSDLVGDGAGGAWISTEFAGRILELDPRSLAVRRELRVAGAETNKIVVDAAAGEAFSAGLWSDAALHRVALDGRELAARPVGTHQWDLGYDPESRRLYLPRLVDGRVHVLDAGSLQTLATWDAGFGVRPLEVSFDGSLVVTGNLYTGELVGWDAASGDVAWRHAIGGPIKGLHVSAEGRVFSGSHCGVYEVSQ